MPAYFVTFDVVREVKRRGEAGERDDGTPVDNLKEVRPFTSYVIPLVSDIPLNCDRKMWVCIRERIMSLGHVPPDAKFKNVRMTPVEQFCDDVGAYENYVAMKWENLTT
jgi:hypothetical protein